MAETFLKSVHDAVNREYDYIIVGMYLYHSHLTFLILILTRSIGGGVGVTLSLTALAHMSHIRRPQVL
jgi:hypothetical protein